MDTATERKPMSLSWPEAHHPRRVSIKEDLPGTVGHPKMQVIPDLKSKTITDIVGGQLKPSVELGTEDSTSHVKLQTHRLPQDHHFRQGNCQSSPTPPWMRIAISNAKRMLGGHHKVEGQYLQLYLNESCYKFDRRSFDERPSDSMAAITCTTNFRARTYRRTLYRQHLIKEC